MASVVVMPAAASVGSVAHNVIVAARAQKEPGMISSDAVSSMTLFPRAASHKCLPWKSAFCSRLVPVPLFSGSSNFRAERRRGLAVVSKVSETETKTKISEASEATESTEELQETLNSALKSVQEAWDKVDDKLAVGGLGFAALILLFASSGLINAIDKLPLIPAVFEFVGILFSGWFVYRYLLFKPDREELLKVIDDVKSKITGQ
ncbi:unnamed protein product [Sphagnum compactum]